ncbi:nitrite reductase [uncultured Methylobacterium sp.]|uniref:nitrite reductase n=1 Tax=uncultured Methylobacterium sp. TaxID=157278 RepID=UPI0025952E72|nr:nitrite reductase [uncultured Methylobacterium sp.]
MSVDPAPRRGWCPGLTRPMPTGDGLLVRLHPVSGRLSAEQVRAAARAAREGGNGLLDVTARGNLQIRGVTAESHGRVVGILAAAGLGDARHDGGPQRLTLDAPLAGADALAVVAAVEAIGREVAGLPAKTLVAVEDAAGGLGPVEADVWVRVAPDAEGRLTSMSPYRARVFSFSSPRPRGEEMRTGRRAVSEGVEDTLFPALQLAIATPAAPLWLAPVPGPAALAVLRTLLQGLAASGARRMRALPEAERDALLDGLPWGDAPPAGTVPPAGLHGRTLLAELPFGRGDAALLDHLAGWSERYGDGHLALTPGRGIALTAQDESSAARLRDEAASAGLIVDPADPRRAVAACPGAPACASGGTPAQGDAPRLAAAFAALARQGATAHVSGCPKGCAHPGPAALTLVGRPDGRYGVVLDGHAGSDPDRVLAFGAVLERLESLRELSSPQAESGLRDAFREPA